MSRAYLGNATPVRRPEYTRIEDEYFNTDDIVIYTHQGYMSSDGYVPPESELAQILGGFGSKSWRMSSFAYSQENNKPVSEPNWETPSARFCREIYDIKLIRNGKILTSVGQDKLQLADARDIVKQKTFYKENDNG